MHLVLQITLYDQFFNVFNLKEGKTHFHKHAHPPTRFPFKV